MTDDDLNLATGESDNIWIGMRRYVGADLLIEVLNIISEFDNDDITAERGKELRARLNEIKTGQARAIAMEWKVIS